MTDAGILHTRTRKFAKVPAALIHDTRITPGAVRLYGHMHWRYGSNQKNFEGRSSMATYLGVSEKTISKWIRELEAHAWIVVVERDYNPATGKYRTPFYHVFEVRRDAHRFRSQYSAAEGECLRELPEVAPRKSRDGVGGKPSHKREKRTEGTQVPRGTQVPGYEGTQVPAIQNQLYLDSLSFIGERQLFPIFFTSGMTYTDGMAVDPLQFPIVVNAIFYAYLDVLKEVGREPAAMHEWLWQHHRDDAKELARARISPGQVQAYVRHKYSGTDQAYWSQIDNALPLKNVVNGIKGFLARRRTPPESSSAAPRAAASASAPEPETPPEVQSQFLKVFQTAGAAHAS